MLQTRNGKRTAPAAVRIAVEMVEEELIDERGGGAARRPAQLDQLLHPTFDPEAQKRGGRAGPRRPAPGAGGRRASCSTPTEAEQRGRERREGAPGAQRDQARGHRTACTPPQGILTARGGMTCTPPWSPAAWASRCVAGAGRSRSTTRRRHAHVGGNDVHGGRRAHDRRHDRRGDRRAAIAAGAAAARQRRLRSTLMAWADEIRQAADPHQRRHARTTRGRRASSAPRASASAAPSTCSSARSRIAADARDDPGRRRRAAPRRALAKLLPMQQGDFVGIFKAMDGLPVTIRLLDPPLHEFLPARGDEAESRERAGAQQMASSRPERSLDARAELHEANPMLGIRGCRLAITVPRDLRDAGAGDHRGGRSTRQKARRRSSRDHDPAGRAPSRSCGACESMHAPRWRARYGRADGRLEYPDRHDDRGAAGRADRRRDRRGAPTSSASAPTT